MSPPRCLASMTHVAQASIPLNEVDPCFLTPIHYAHNTSPPLITIDKTLPLV